MEILNAIAVLLSTISSVYLLQEKFIVSNSSALTHADRITIRGLIAGLNAAQLASLLTPVSIPLVFLNATLALTKVYIIKKF